VVARVVVHLAQNDALNFHPVVLVVEVILCHNLANPDKHAVVAPPHEGEVVMVLDKVAARLITVDMTLGDLFVLLQRPTRLDEYIGSIMVGQLIMQPLSDGLN
jgi:hypothetical protein